MEIKFAHTSDWHFGQVQYRKYERWEDIIKAAKKFKNHVVKLIIENKLDFIIHSGDIYHYYHPSSGTFLQLYEILDEIRQAFIESGKITENENSLFITIRGNHDATSKTEGIKGGNALDALHRLKVVSYLNDAAIELKDNIKIYGIGYYGQGIKDKLSELIESDPLDHKKCNILIVHAGITEYVKGYMSDISQGEILERGFAYTCVGHYHLEFLNEKSRIGNPGSIEHISRLEWSEKIEGYHTTKPWHLITLNKNGKVWIANVERVTIKVRPKKWLEVLIKGSNIEEVEGEIEKGVRPYLKDKNMIFVSIKGLIPQGLFLQNIFDRLLEDMEGELVYFDYDYNPTLNSDIINRDFSNEDEIIKDFLKLRNIDENEIPQWLRLIKSSVSLLSGKTSYNKDDDKIIEVANLVEEFQKGGDQL